MGQNLFRTHNSTIKVRGTNGVGLDIFRDTPSAVGVVRPDAQLINVVGVVILDLQVINGVFEAVKR